MENEVTDEMVLVIREMAMAISDEQAAESFIDMHKEDVVFGEMKLNVMKERVCILMNRLADMGRDLKADKEQQRVERECEYAKNR